MTDSELRIAIAKGIGWKFFHMETGGYEIHDPTGGYYRGYDIETGLSLCAVPDYPNDIREAYKLEDSVPEGERSKYTAILEEIVGCSNGRYGGLINLAEAWNVAHATARQKTEAYAIWKGVE
jgi:hypothetical protein